MAATPGLDLQLGVGRTLDDCSDMLCCFRVGYCCRSDRDVEVIGMDVRNLIQRVGREPQKFVAPANSVDEAIVDGYTRRVTHSSFLRPQSNGNRWAKVDKGRRNERQETEKGIQLT